MMPVKSLNHIGIAVRAIEPQRTFYEDVLGATFEGIEEVPSQHVRVAFFRIGDVRIELLQSTDPQSPIARFIDKRGEGLHHLAFLVDDLRTRIDQITQSGLNMIDSEPRPGADQMDVAFIHPNSCGGVLTELCQSRTR
ncbi:methylmalonyl-CoA epimerase [Rhodopirellula maiorica SM1]|uniref:Methylmalonyl-CoA epimerase n=1 Tax=Rhodopirellula maiorica SM1 TaxID=1265738 RepID=M5R8I0_9BACT|nr:methylmalonyl-CoA epimerase [Rhodopirellula maiorica]EMI15346.1 methylmalonyl-CoA epimerase [Rhodopirellula maiorica SM1]